MTVLGSHADGIAEELDRPYRTIQINERENVNGYMMTVETAEGYPVHPEDITQLESDGWNFVCFKENYALFEKGPNL